MDQVEQATTVAEEDKPGCVIMATPVNYRRVGEYDYIVTFLDGTYAWTAHTTDPRVAMAAWQHLHSKCLVTLSLRGVLLGLGDLT